MLSRIVTALLLALAAQPGMAKDTVTLRVGEQNYFNIQASMEASGVLKDLPYDRVEAFPGTRRPSPNR